jgi:hypothetical protein
LREQVDRRIHHHITTGKEVGMTKMFTLLRDWLAPLVAQPASPDPFAGMSARELADLPATHPPTDR